MTTHFTPSPKKKFPSNSKIRHPQSCGSPIICIHTNFTTKWKIQWKYFFNSKKLRLSEIKAEKIHKEKATRETRN